MVIGAILSLVLLVCCIFAVLLKRREFVLVLLFSLWYLPLALGGNEELSLAVLLFILPTFLILLAIAVKGKSIRFSTVTDDVVMTFSLLIMALSLVMTQFSVGLQNLAVNKLVNGQVIENFTRWSVLLYSSMAYVAILLFVRRRYLLTLVILFSFLVLGDRTQFFFVLLSLFLLYWDKITIKKMAIIIPLIILGFLGKSIYIFLFTGHFPSLLNYSLDTLSLANTTQSALEMGPIHYEMGYLLDLPLILLPINLSENLHYFSEIYKETFYPHWSDSTGSAGNVLVELYWIGGYFFIFLFGIAYSILTLYALFKVKGKYMGIASVLLLVVLWFYVPRNSIFTLISHLKKFIYLFVIIMLLRKFYVSFSRSSQL